MKRKLCLASVLLPMVFLLLLSCKKEVGIETLPETITDATATGAVGTEGRMLESQLLKSLRQATSRYHSTTLAMQAGYVPDDHCVAHPALGGMGYHWVNGSLVDPVFDPLQPEVLLYARGPGGNLRLVAVEYIVINVNQPAPMFGNQAFMVGGAPPVPVPHWTLHVWVHENNPSGMFAPFNPNISCN